MFLGSQGKDRLWTEG